MNDRPDPVVVRLDEQFAAWTGTATPEIVGLIATLFGAEGDTRTRSLFDWQYLEHLGGAHVCIAYTDRGLFAEPAALYAAFPTRFQLNGHSSIAYQSFDTLTVAAFRGRGLFVRLADLAYRQIADRGASLVYGVPNGNSFGGFIRRLGWSELDPLPMLVRPIGLRYLRSRMGFRRSKLMAAPSNCDLLMRGGELTELFARSQYAGHSGVIRDAEYLRWRLQRPGSSYRLLESRNSQGELIGLAVIEVLAKHGGTVGYLMEFMIDQTVLDEGRHLLDRALGELAAAGADVVLAWTMPDDPAQRLLQERGFRNLPTRLSPIELHLGYRSFVDDVQLTRRELRWSYLDSDTV